MLSIPASSFQLPLDLPETMCSALIVRDETKGQFVGKQKRESEHADGRRAAAQALQQLDRAGTVGRHENGCPMWPRGVVGSISHTNHYAWALVGSSQEFRSIGIDTEPMCENSTVDSLWEQVAGGTEWRLARDAGLGRVEAFTAVFSAKESLYKCIYPISPAFFDFKDACLIKTGADTLTLRINDDCPNRLVRGAELDVSFAFSSGDVFTACCMRKGANHGC